MRRATPNFCKINNKHKRQEKKMVITNLLLDTEKNPWWIITYQITFRGIPDVEKKLLNACANGWLVFEKKVRRGKRGHLVRDIVYFWSPSKKFALRLTWYVHSSPHLLEVTGDLESARRFLYKINL